MPRRRRNRENVSRRNYKKVDFSSLTSNDISPGHLRAHNLLAEKLRARADPDPIVPRIWQSAVAHELICGHDVVLKAGTGSGKTLAFHAVPMLDPEAILMVISPLNALMNDQADRAIALGIKAACLNAEALEEDPELIDKVRQGKYQLVNVAAEFTDNSNENWKRLIGKTNPSEFQKRLSLIVIDEGHLIREWRKFRPVYRNIGLLKARWSKVPFLICSGTLPGYVLEYVHKVLEMLPATVFCELDTDRPNITIMTAPIPHGTVGSRKSLEFLVPETSRQVEEGPDFDLIAETIPKTIVFVDDKKTAWHLTTQLISLCPEWSRANKNTGRAFSFIREYHSDISLPAKSRNMTDFRGDLTKIFICTDAVGMGVDIPDVERVIQWKVPEFLSLCGLWQRFGRAARHPSMQGLGIIYYEPAMQIPGALEADFDDAVAKKVVEDTYLTKDHESRAAVLKGDISAEADDETADRRKSGRPRVAPSELREQHLLWFLNTKGCLRKIIMAYLGSPVMPSEFPCCDRCMKTAGFETEGCTVIPLDCTTPYYVKPDKPT